MHMRRRRIRNANETLIDFLARELRPTRRDDAEHFAKAIREAGERYNRYDERRAGWGKKNPPQNPPAQKKSAAGGLLAEPFRVRLFSVPRCRKPSRPLCMHHPK